MKENCRSSCPLEGVSLQGYRSDGPANCTSMRICEIRKASKMSKVRRPLTVGMLRNILNSRGASGGCLHGGASFKVEKAHLLHEERVRRTANMN